MGKILVLIKISCIGT